MSQVSAEFIPTRIAILTVSDRRGEEDDTSGHWLREAAHDAGHHIVDKAIVKENRYAIRAQVSQWIASDEVQVVLITGGTGFTGRDSTPEAVACLLDKQVDGFGEYFRQISVADVGTSSMQSRALAGLANGTKGTGDRDCNILGKGKIHAIHLGDEGCSHGIVGGIAVHIDGSSQWQGEGGGLLGNAEFSDGCVHIQWQRGH